MSAPCKLHRYVLICLLFAGCGPADTSETSGRQPATQSNRTTDASPLASTLTEADTADLAILMFGNSHTSSFNVPGLIEGLHQARKPDEKAVAYARFGGTLGPIDADEANHDLIRNHKWDVVILQGQEISTSGKYYYSIEPAVNLAKTIAETDARCLLFAEWAIKGDDHQRFEDVYHDIAAKSKSTVVPVGKAFAKATSERPDLELYSSDGNHASAAGSYLAACMLYGAVSGVNPAEITNDPVNGTTLDVSDEDRAFLRKIAGQTLEDNSLLANDGE